ncbi:MAG: tetratricopeptide repeat protein [Spirochaetales bacterium]|nr:tetratricopeptide repeat protein [Spirochaetales bacterium]
MIEATLSGGIRLYNSKRYEAALAEFLSMDEDPAENAELAYYLGLCYTKLEKFDEALLYLEQVVTNHTNLLLIYQSRMILGYIYSVTERYRLAEFEMKQLVDGGYESPQVYAAIGYIHFMLNRTEESLKALQKALKLDPDNANALNSLGYIMAEKDLDLDTAIAYCLAAVRISPNNWAYLDSLGWAYFKAGRFPEAREYLRKSMEASRGNKTVAVHMKEVLDQH